MIRVSISKYDKTIPLNIKLRCNLEIKPMSSYHSIHYHMSERKMYYGYCADAVKPKLLRSKLVLILELESLSITLNSKN